VTEDADSKAALWTFVGMIAGFKIITSIIIFVMEPSIASAAFLVAMQWYWLLIPLPFIIVPALFWYRLWKVRRRRRQLIRSEWKVEPELDEADWNPTSARGTM
jgi:hypothetical protein